MCRNVLYGRPRKLRICFGPFRFRYILVNANSPENYWMIVSYKLLQVSVKLRRLQITAILILNGANRHDTNTARIVIHPGGCSSWLGTAAYCYWAWAPIDLQAISFIMHCNNFLNYGA
jgi:hypothetical protein